MKALVLVALLVMAGVAVTALAYRRRTVAAQRRAMRHRRRADERVVWDRHMAAKAPEPRQPPPAL